MLKSKSYHQGLLCLKRLCFNILIFLNPIQTWGEAGRRLTPPRFKSFVTHERLRLQCFYFVKFPQIYLGTI